MPKSNWYCAGTSAHSANGFRGVSSDAAACGTGVMIHNIKQATAAEGHSRLAVHCCSRFVFFVLFFIDALCLAASAIIQLPIRSQKSNAEPAGDGGAVPETKACRRGDKRQSTLQSTGSHTPGSLPLRDYTGKQLKAGAAGTSAQAARFQNRKPGGRWGICRLMPWPRRDSWQPPAS